MVHGADITEDNIASLGYAAILGSDFFIKSVPSYIPLRDINLMIDPVEVDQPCLRI